MKNIHIRGILRIICEKGINDCILTIDNALEYIKINTEARILQYYENE